MWWVLCFQVWRVAGVAGVAVAGGVGGWRVPCAQGTGHCEWVYFPWFYVV